jgi:hypothetical protein
MRRRVFAVASAISLLLGVGTVLLWVISYERAIVLIVQPPPHNITSVSIFADRGALELSLNDAIEDERTLGSGWTIDLSIREVSSIWDVFPSTPLPRLWFHYVSFLNSRGSVLIPDWAVACAALCLPTAWARRSRVEQRGSFGHCLGCGYSLL